MALVTYFKRDRRRTKCPDCGRDLIWAATGQRFCAYAEDHTTGTPLVERPAPVVSRGVSSRSARTIEGGHMAAERNAIERLRAALEGAPYGVREDGTRSYSPRWENAVDALAAVDALYQAAKEIVEPTDYRPGAAYRRKAALAAAVRRVEAGA